MAPLPDRYGDEVDKQNHDEEAVVSDNFLTTIALLAGACGIALMSSALSLKSDGIYAFGDFALQVVQLPQYLQYCCYGTMITGLGTFITGCVGGWVSLKNHRKAMKAFLVLLLFFAIIQLAAGAGILVFIGFINDAVYNQSGNGSKVGGVSSQVSNFQYSMFNLCCAQLGNTDPSEGIVSLCASTCPNGIKPPNAKSTDITSCYCEAEQQQYYQFEGVVGANKEYVCNLLKKATVDVTGVKIPGTTIEVTFRTGKIVILPIVGNYTTPIFGCGNGYAKAFQAAQFLWLEQHSKPLGATCIICAIAQLVMISLGCTAMAYGGQGAIAGSSEPGEKLTAYEKYMREVQAGQRAHTGENFEIVAPGHRVSMSSNRSNDPGYGHQPGFNNRPGARMSMGSSKMAEVPVAHVVPPSFNVDDKI